MRTYVIDFIAMHISEYIVTRVLRHSCLSRLDEYPASERIWNRLLTRVCLSGSRQRMKATGVRFS